MIRDPENDHKKCGIFEGSSNRTWKLWNSNATEPDCQKRCEEDKNCKAMSGIWNYFCIGCKVALNSSHPGAQAFKKDIKGKFLNMNQK